jgi:hypothetical protein
LLTTLWALPEKFYAYPGTITPDCNHSAKVAMLRTAAGLAAHVMQQRPVVVISTGALPGVIALALQRVRGASTIWSDRLVNAEAISSKLPRRFALLWLSQRGQVAREAGGRVRSNRAVILATVRTQIPFPHMIGVLDALAPQLGEEIGAQVEPVPARVSSTIARFFDEEMVGLFEAENAESLAKGILHPFWEPWRRRRIRT